MRDHEHGNAGGARAARGLTGRERMETPLSDREEVRWLDQPTRLCQGRAPEAGGPVWHTLSADGVLQETTQ